jgi:hypothetical protein
MQTGKNRRPGTFPDLLAQFVFVQEMGQERRPGHGNGKGQKGDEKNLDDNTI